MLGMVADPAAATNKFFYTCIAVAKANGDPKGVEVWKWRLDSPTTATKIKTLISGIPLKPAAGTAAAGCASVRPRRSTSAPAMPRSAPTRRV